MLLIYDTIQVQMKKIVMKTIICSMWYVKLWQNPAND